MTTSLYFPNTANFYIKDGVSKEQCLFSCVLNNFGVE